MNQAASHIANRSSKGLYRVEGFFFNTKRGQKKEKEIINKECIISGKVALPKGTEGPLTQADYPTSVKKHSSSHEKEGGTEMFLVSFPQTAIQASKPSYPLFSYISCSKLSQPSIVSSLEPRSIF